jgi:hypothetical protein
VANLRPPNDQVRVEFDDPSGAVTTTLDPNPDPTTDTSPLTISSLSLANRDTGTYAFRVMNPNGATASNALSFSVTPGLPTIAGSPPVCRLSGTSCASTNPTSAVQQSAPVPVRISGTNFAKPDASGNGSMVMVTADFMPNWPNIDPCGVTTSTATQFVPVPGTVTVKSPTEIEVQLDTLAAYVDPTAGTTYYIGVWNPGGASGLQKSSCGKTLTTLPSFRITPQ